MMSCVELLSERDVKRGREDVHLTPACDGRFSDVGNVGARCEGGGVAMTACGDEAAWGQAARRGKATS